MSEDGPFIRYEVDDGIGVITIDRPEKRNAMTFAMLREFIAAVGAAGADDAARVVIITGSGGSFCAGTDLSDLSGTPTEERGSRGGGVGGAGASSASAAATAWPIVACPKPVIGAIDGPAVGMGAEFTSQCDVRIATDRARFAWNFVHRGLVPDTGAGSWLLPRLVGLPTALRILYSGDFVSAAEALEIGYVAAVVPPEELMAAAAAEAQRFLRGSPFAIQRVKELVYRGLESSSADHLDRHRQALSECFASEDHKEGVASFLERREAKFTGR
jgi:enoyl-CoA hydratase